MAEQEENKQHFSLFELNQHLRRVLSFNMRNPLWIQCEIAELSHNRGNVYLNLVERDEFQLRAKARAMIRKYQFQKIKNQIGDPLGSILQIGQQIRLQVQVEFSEIFGMSLQVLDLEPVFTIGQLELQRSTTLKKLEQEQFIDINKQLNLPLVPQRIAIVSSKDAAGLRDFLEQLHNNPHRYAYETELFQSAVQGVHAAKELTEQLNLIESQQQAFDCIVLIRGGGSRMDLMGFDDFELCKTIALCELPVITGIGHDVDETLADLVAHTALKTPTAVADFLIQKTQLFESALQNYSLELQQIVRSRLQKEQLRIQSIQQQFKHQVNSRFQQTRNQLLQLENRLQLLALDKSLQRGFALISDEAGNILKSIDQAKKGDLITIKMKDGQFKAIIQ